MSCYTIYYDNDKRKMMRAVEGREDYLRLRGSAQQEATVRQVRQGNGNAKLRLLQCNYSCMPNADGTLKGSTTMSTTVGMDVDHIAAEDMAATRDRILAKRDELGLLMLELSARGEGFHLVFRRREGLSQEDNLHWASDLLGVAFDTGAKDHTRVFFTTTASADDLLFLDDALFVNEAAQGLPPAAAPLPPTPAPQMPTAAEGPEPGGYEGHYDGIPYEAIVEALENQLGGVPTHGSRNQFIFAMACHLRYVCNDDPRWIAAVLPTYGEEREKWMRTIESACRRSQNQTMPRLLRTALELARCDSRTEDSEGKGFDSELPPPMPARLPPLIRLLVSKTPKVYQPAVAHAVFPALAAHLWKTRFRYIDNVEHEATLMNVLMAGTGAGKNCIAEPIRMIMRDIVERDQINREKERQWKEEMQTKGSNKDKRRRPEGLVIQHVKPDMTNAAFVQRMKEAEGHFLYTQMNEIDQFDALKTSARSKSQFQIMCLAFDPQNSYGTERVGTASVSETVCVRFNWNASTTIQKGKAYFAKVVTDGPISRINFCTIPERPIGAELPVYGIYDEGFEAELKPYIDRLNAARGLIECPKARTLARKLMEENADFARLSQSRVYENLSFRGNVIAFLKAMVLYVAQGEKWDKVLEDFVRWSERYDLWCKMKFFGEAIAEAETTVRSHRPGPQNLLTLLGNEFTTDELQQVRRRQGVEKTPLAALLKVWRSRNYVEPVEGKANTWRKVGG
ncbi:MAG: hypothetical protein MJZ86_00810 [Bacteroidales bacterium]|nr:hypothetical protein [Bacteroidales bacterium]